MVDMIAIEELRKYIRSEWRPIVGIEHARWSLQGDELLQVHG